jgi:hypothetical protein
MPGYICAISTRGREPAAYALVEQAREHEARRPMYTIHDIGRFGEGSAIEQLQDLLAGDPVIPGRTVLVVQGGHRVAGGFHDAGMTAVPVETQPPGSRDGDTISVSEQTAIDTFEGMYRRTEVAVRGENELAARAIRALYLVMSDDAGADDIPDHLAAEIPDEVGPPPPEDDAKPDVIALSGRETSISTAIVADQEHPHDMLPLAVDEAEPRRRGLVDEGPNTTLEVDMGDDHDIAMALALAVWYGEYSADEVPVTDQAATSRRARDVRRNRRQAARGR